MGSFLFILALFILLVLLPNAEGREHSDLWEERMKKMDDLKKDGKSKPAPPATAEKEKP